MVEDGVDGGATLIGGITNCGTGFKLKNKKLELALVRGFRWRSCNSPLDALLLNLLFVDSLQLTLHDSTERNTTGALSAELRMIKAQRHQLRADGTAADVAGSLSLTSSRMLDDSLHLLTSSSGTSCSHSAVESVDEGRKAPVDGLLS